MANHTTTESLATMRTPPHSLEAEQAVIGGLLLDPNAWDKIADLLFDSDFYHERNRILFTAIRELAEDGQPLDIVTVSDSLAKAKRKDENIFLYLSTLAKETPSAANIKAYADIVHRDAVKRKLITAATTVIEHCYNPANQDSQELLNEAEQLMFKVSDDSRKEGDFQSMKDLSASVFQEISKRSESDQSITGVPTGFKEIDEKTDGLQKGDLVIIAGRPSMGKTSLALNIVEHIAIREKEKSGTIAIFSMEMSAEQITTRLYSSVAKINQSRLRNGQLSHDEWPSMTDWHQRLANTSIFISDSSAMTPVEVCSQVRRLKREHDDLALVVVDYLQLMYVRANVETRAVEISAISRALKGLAREVDVPLVALSQLNRDIERTRRKPQMSDLRESGAIEQDADLIMMIYRDSDRDDQSTDSIVNVEIVKQRNGPTFSTKLTFIGQYTRFENYVPEEIMANQPFFSEKKVSSFDQMP